jgi:hypothetical protein
LAEGVLQDVAAEFLVVQTVALKRELREEADLLTVHLWQDSQHILFDLVEHFGCDCHVHQQAIIIDYSHQARIQFSQC